MLRVVDISSYQGDNGIDPAALDCDAVIVKATGGNGYVNGYWREHAEAVLASGKLLGLYHYAWEKGFHGTVQEEVSHFLSAVSDYVGRAVLALDWEKEAQMLPVSWAREWLGAVASATGAIPFFYAYASYLNSRDHRELTAFPLWMASYLYRYTGASWESDPINIWETSSWSDMTMYQYTSTGRVEGYGDVLDLSVFYGSREEWIRMQGGERRKLNLVAAEIHRRMCQDDRHGYSWEERWGAYTETWEVMGQCYVVSIGDYDCSSSSIKAWSLALQGTPYEGALDGAISTHNMRSVFVGSGLFDWVPVSEAQPGDLYLNEQNHVAMCQGDGLLSEFSWGDNGAYGNIRGDQSGQEASVHGYYDYSGGWDGCLHYNGKADPVGAATSEEDEMQFIYKPDGKDYLVYHTGTANIRFRCPDQKDAVVKAYKQATGRDIPVFEFGTEEAPEGARFEQCFPYYVAGDQFDLGVHAQLVEYGDGL